MLLRNPSDLQSLLVQNSKESCLSQTSASNSNASSSTLANHESKAVKKCNYSIFSRYIHSPIHRTLSNLYNENSEKANMYPFGVCTVKLPPALNEPVERVFIPHAPYIKTVPVFAPFIHNVQQNEEEERNVMEELPIEHATKMPSTTTATTTTATTASESFSTSTFATSTSITTTWEPIGSPNYNNNTSENKNKENEVNYEHGNQIITPISSLENLQKLENTLPEVLLPNAEQESREWYLAPETTYSAQFTLSTASSELASVSSSSTSSSSSSEPKQKPSLVAEISKLPTITSSESVTVKEILAGPVINTVIRALDVPNSTKEEQNLSPEPEPPKLLSLSSYNETNIPHCDTAAQEISSPIVLVKKNTRITVSTRKVEEHIEPQISETILVSSGSWAPKSINNNNSNNDSDDVALLTSSKKRWLENRRGRGLLERQHRYWNRLLRSKVTLQVPEPVPLCTSDDLSSSTAIPLSHINTSASEQFESNTIDNVNCNQDIVTQSTTDDKDKFKETTQDALQVSANVMSSFCQNQSNKNDKESATVETSPFPNVMPNPSTVNEKSTDVSTKCETNSEVARETCDIASNIDSSNNLANSVPKEGKQEKNSETENAPSETTCELTKYKPRFNMYKSDGTVRRVKRYSVYSNSSYVPSSHSFDEESPNSNLSGSISAGFAVPQSTKEVLAEVYKVISPTRKSAYSHVDEPYEPVSHVSSTALPDAYYHSYGKNVNKTNTISKDDNKNENDDYVHSFNPVQHHERKNWLTQADIKNMQPEKCYELKMHQDAKTRFTNKQYWWGNEGNAERETWRDGNKNNNNNNKNSTTAEQNDMRELHLSRSNIAKVESNSCNKQLVNLERDKNTCSNINSVICDNNNRSKSTSRSGKSETVRESSNETFLSPSESEYWKVTNFDSSESEAVKTLPYESPNVNMLKENSSKWTVFSNESKKDSSAVRISAIPFMKRESVKDYNQLTCSSISTTPFITDTSTTLTTEMQSEEFSRLDPRRRLHRRTTLRSTAASENDAEDINSRVSTNKKTDNNM